MTKLQERVNFRKGKNFRKGLKGETLVKGEKQKTFEKVLTLWRNGKTIGEKCAFHFKKLKNKLQRNSQQGVKSNGTLPIPQTKTFWPQALKPQTEVTSHN